MFSNIKLNNLYLILLLIILICVCYYSIVYINNDIEQFETTTVPAGSGTTTTLQSVTGTESTTTTLQSGREIPIMNIPLEIMNQILPAIGPCKTLRISSLDLNLAGVLIFNQWGNNIFYNSKIQLSQTQITGFYRQQIVTTNESIESTDISPLFENTHNMQFNNEICNFDKTFENTTPGYYVFSCINLNIKNTREAYYAIEQRKMFTTPQNTKTDVFINIPIINQNNINITKIILFLNPELNNLNMLNSLQIELIDSNDSLIKWSTVKTTINNVPPISVITFSLESNTNTIITQSGGSSFQNINSIKEKFNTLNLNISNIDNIDNNKVIPVPLDTLQSGTTTTSQSGTGTSGTTTTSQSGTGTTTTKYNTASTIPLTTYGYKMNNSLNPLDSNSQTNLYQKNFDGTSNVYAPYIYYNMEPFTPINQHDDTYSSY